MASITRFYALILSTVLLLSGIPGIFPNVVSFQPLVTFFALTLVHGVVHVAVGVLGLLITALASDESVRVYTLGIALLYGILAVVGLVGINFAPVLYFNDADNWLHGAIFMLSLGIFLAGLAESGIHARRQRIIEALPESHWAIPSAPARTPARTTSAPMAHPPLPSPASNNAPDSTVSPWFNPTLSQQSYQRPPSEPAPARDPWTREQRRLPYGSSASGASSPSQGQPASPWPQYPAPRWPQSQPTPSQPSRAPSGWEGWPQDRAPADAQRNAQQRDQWPMDEWPSLDSRPLQ